ncbi:MAG TPA: septum formation initiator [Synergistales bacterium]|nr:septum formation initiator [Synergistales bacterium]HPC75409.1 septum formation initiator [Synergistales bacterium]HRS48154.1 septum formation initiator [Thermovirgaceae bacterium]HRU90652.1 septum formation initiator [Thermovirgaceae bacterium]
MIRLRWVALITAGLCFLAIVGTAYILELKKIGRLGSIVDERMDRLVAATRDVQVLKEKILFYKTPEGVARLAREQFNLTLPGERIFRVEVVSQDPLPEKGP